MRGRMALMVAAALGLGSAFGGMPNAGGQLIEKAALRPQQPRGNTLRAILGGGFGSPVGRGRRAGFGWTNAHAQRVARKKHNQARHRAACRGRKRA